MGWPAIIGAIGAIGGGLLSSRGAGDAADAATAGSLAEIEYNRESRDLVRQDQHPYRQAGYSALNALMSMTGLPNSELWYGGGSKTPEAPTAWRSRWDVENPRQLDASHRSTAWRNAVRIRPNYDGGEMTPETMYNVNELGPENIYSKGRMTRGKGPVTIDGETGYVEPNVEGRAEGGIIGGMHDRKIDAPWMIEGGQPATQPPKPPANLPPTPSHFPRENPGGQEGGYNFMTDPGYEFRFEEGQRALDRGASARGGLLSGGYGRKAIRYGQNFASGEYANVYNRIANIAGLGQTANQQSGNAALMAGANMGTAAAQAGAARASGYGAMNNAWANTANQLAQLPWGDYFGGSNTAVGSNVGLSGSNGGPI